MRLTAHEIEAIKTAARDAFGDTVVVRLFGSRVHDHLRGGDVDLHFETDEVTDEWRQRADFETRLFGQVEPRKVDVVLSIRGREPRGFERIAYRDGIVL